MINFSILFSGLNKIGTEIDSYCLINNLCTFDKIIEQYIKEHIDIYNEAYNIIDTNQYGLRKKHGTNTAII